MRRERTFRYLAGATKCRPGGVLQRLNGLRRVAKMHRSCRVHEERGASMNYRRLGRSGLQVSELSLGSWVTYHNQVDEAAAREMLAAAFDAGVNFFDNAEVYAAGESEKLMGEAIKAL